MQKTRSVKKRMAPPIPREREIPESFLKAAGMLKQHAKALRAHTKKVRAEWDARKF